RKHLLDFDDVANDQRKVIYEQRNELMEAESIQESVDDVRHDVITDVTRQYVPANSIDEIWDLPGLEKALESDFGVRVDAQTWLKDSEELDADGVLRRTLEAVDRAFREKETLVGSDIMRQLEKHMMLSVLDQQWKEHLASMDYLRQGIHLRGYAQKQPKQEFKRESFELFSNMLDNIKREVISLISRVRIRSDEEVAQLEAQQRAAQQNAPLQMQHTAHAGIGGPEQAEPQVAMQTASLGTVTRGEAKVGRNEPCPCGSGKKYKQCHGKLS